MRTIIAGNWKMHKDKAETLAFIKALADPALDLPGDVDMVIAPAFAFLDAAAQATEGHRLKVAAQNCHEEVKGAFTGEVSVSMLKSLGVQYCIVGHSERRQYFGETDAVVGKKIAALLNNGLKPIYCCGEDRKQREEARHFDTVATQLHTALSTFKPEALKDLIVAYEPVWAIGTGLNASPEQAQEMHAFIRAELRRLSSDADQIPILYGGSCKPDNAEGIFSCADVNGGLIGGASLEPASFAELVRIAHRVKSS